MRDRCLNLLDIHSKKPPSQTDKLLLFYDDIDDMLPCCFIVNIFCVTISEYAKADHQSAHYDADDECQEDDQPQPDRKYAPSRLFISSHFFFFLIIGPFFLM